MTGRGRRGLPEGGRLVATVGVGVRSAGRPGCDGGEIRGGAGDVAWYVAMKRGETVGPARTRAAGAPRAQCCAPALRRC